MTWKDPEVKNPMRMLAALVAAGALTLTACGGGSTDSGSDGTPAGGGSDSYTIGINVFDSHPSLDAARDGFMQAIEDAGLDVTYDEQNAQGDQSTAAAISSKFATSDIDLVLAIATPSAQATAQAVTEIPVLFTAVTDPVSAELVDSNEAPGANVTGTSDINPVADQIALIKQIVPDAENFGIVYSSGEINSAVQVEMAREAAQAEGLEVVEKTISARAEVLQGVQALGDVDAIYVPTDNFVVAGLDSVLQVAEEKKIPVIVAETDSVNKGGLITLGISYFDLGVQTGEMAVQILTEGADPATLAVGTQPGTRLVINTSAAERMGITVPQELLDAADEKVS
ncbi:MAG: ABC transporter substrate-binding protein [Brooklawnia sp.]|jgi:putative ABC transport system substrate-binding protein